MIIDIEIADPAWGDVDQSVRRAANAALAAVFPDGKTRELSIRLSDNEEVRGLNRDYRDKDKPTNVLSFESEMPDMAWPEGEPYPIGDIIVAYETVRDEALAQGKDLENHLCHLIVHGVLHLSGYDHEDDTTAEKMEALEITILASLGISDPYQA